MRPIQDEAALAHELGHIQLEAIPRRGASADRQPRFFVSPALTRYAARGPGARAWPHSARSPRGPAHARPDGGDLPSNDSGLRSTPGGRGCRFAVDLLRRIEPRHPGACIALVYVFALLAEQPWVVPGWRAILRRMAGPKRRWRGATAAEPGVFHAARGGLARRRPPAPRAGREGVVLPPYPSDSRSLRALWLGVQKGRLHIF